MAGRSITYVDGAWHEGNPPLIGPMTHALWMSSVVFDGARSFGRLAPDLDRHCERVIESARAFGMIPKVTAEEIERLAWDGIDQFADDAALYIRPLFYFEEGFVAPDPDSARFILTVFESPMPPFRGMTACVSSFRRPGPDMAPTNAKASCLYPNVGRALMEARGKGFDTAVVLDGLNNVAEFATNNIFIVKDSVVMTPAPNGTFLAGLTRRRVIELLHDEGHEVQERTIRLSDVFDADEVFLTGNYSKVLPVVRVEDRDYQQGPIAKLARGLYMDFAEREGGRKV